MRKQLLLTVAALLLAQTGAMAADNMAKTGNSEPASTQAAEPAPGDHNRDWTLDEARKHAHENVEKAQAWAAKVDKMTEKEWAEHEKKYHAFREKMAKMTPEEKKAYWEKRKEKHEKEETSGNSQPSSNK